MKTLNTYITEKFRVHKDVDYGPKSTTNDDIYKIVLDEVKKQAKRPQSASSPIDLNYIDVSKITNMSCLFDTINENVTLEYIDISEWDVSNVEEMKWMFADCKSLVSVGDLSNWKLDNNRTLEGMFENCIKLEHIGDISNWNVENIYDHGFNNMFLNCSKLKGNVGNLLKWNVSPRVLNSLKKQEMI